MQARNIADRPGTLNAVLNCPHHTPVTDDETTWCHTCLVVLDPTRPQQPLLVCGTCEDYVDDARIKPHGPGWRHVTNNSVRCPGQGDDDTDDRATPALAIYERWALPLHGTALTAILTRRS